MYSNIKQSLWEIKYILLFLFIFTVVVFQRFENKIQVNSGLANSVASDGTGYYAYLPATIIYQDFNYEFYSKPENKIKGFYYLYPHTYKEKYHLNKYYCGTAICLLPFFLTGVVVSAIAGTEINGYSDTFLMLVSIASIIYFLIATFLITRIARFFNAPEPLGFWISIVFFFSTNLFHYVIQEPSMSHTYSFFAITLFFYFLTKLISNISTKNIIYLSLSLALIALIRPPNIIVILFIPFFFPNIKECGLFFKTLFVTHFFKILIALLVFFSAISIQFLLYYFQTGDFIVESYPGETFNFLKPELFNILFSYKKGLFLYTPILLFMLLFIFIGNTNWYKRLVFLFTIFIFTYIAASWWCWYYGGGFSGRTYIDIYPLFIITLIVLVLKLSVKWRRVLVFATLPFIFINQIMAYQYSHGIMKGHDMTEIRYKTMMLKTSALSANESLKNKLIQHKTTLNSLCEDFENFESQDYIVSEGFLSGHSYEFGSKFQDSRILKINEQDSKIDLTQPFYIVVECDLKLENDNEKATIITAINDGDAITKWDFALDTQFTSDLSGWKKVTHIVEVQPTEFKKNGIMSVFIHKENGKNLVDNLKYTILQ